jgi:hypothetical protein
MSAGVGWYSAIDAKVPAANVEAVPETHDALC